MLTGIVAVFLAACAAPGVTIDPSSLESFPAASTPASASHGASPSGAEAADAPTGIPNEVWTAVLDDLSRRLQRPVTDPVVTSAEPMTWNDGSLGCPKPGQVYTQALVDGFQVVVEVDGEQFDYRSSGGDSVRLCEGMIEGG